MFSAFILAAFFTLYENSSRSSKNILTADCKLLGNKRASQEHPRTYSHSLQESWDKMCSEFSRIILVVFTQAVVHQACRMKGIAYLIKLMGNNNFRQGCSSFVSCSGAIRCCFSLFSQRVTASRPV